MGYSTRNNGNIKDFWPDDTDTEFYLSYGTDLATILRAISDKWPDTEAEDIIIDPEYIHTSCLTYDQYDAGDWTNFIAIRKVK